MFLCENMYLPKSPSPTPGNTTVSTLGPMVTSLTIRGLESWLTIGKVEGWTQTRDDLQLHVRSSTTGHWLQSPQ